MDATTQKYHLLIMALESRVLKALQSNILIAKKKILEAQLQAAILGSQLAIEQLENELPDEQDISRAHYAPLPPVHLHTVADKDKNLSIASTVARTTIIEAFRQAAIAVYSANQVDGWIWEVEGDNPCPFCESMDGTIHPLTEEFESHPNCRCSTMPSIS
jgi:hypothetical protein